MPKLPKGFGRRKSTANALEELENAPTAAGHSFRVFERPKEPTKSFDGGRTFARIQTAPVPAQQSPPRQKEDNMFEDLKINRGSGASNTNTVSTTDDSSRFSAASTAPSSTSHRSNDDGRLPQNRPYADIPLPPVPKSASGFSLKAAGRTFSFGRGKSTPSPSGTIEEDPSPVRTNSEDSNYSRPRAVTGSSYASTATPPKLEDHNLSLGGSFGDMFSGFSKRKSTVMDIEESRVMSQSPDQLQSGPAFPARSYAPNHGNHPSPLHIDRTKDIEASPYSWSSQHSNDGLMANSSPLYPPTVPRHGSPQSSNPNNNIAPTTRVPRPTASNEGLKRGNAITARRQSTLESDDAEDEDTKFLRESADVIRLLTDDATPARARDSWLVPSTTPSTGSSFNDKPVGTSGWRRDTTLTARQPPKTVNNNPEENMFAKADTPSTTIPRKEVTSNPPRQNNGTTNKVMTPAQFERYRKEQERNNNSSTLVKDADNDEDAYEEDEEDEAEKQKQIAKQRRKQEAHMAVYRQQMMKVTGEAPAPVPNRPGMSFSQSSPNLHKLGSTTPEEGDEEDEEVPLAILAAHGFPNKNRPPVRLSSMNSNPNLRASSQMGAYPPPPQSLVGEPLAGGRLPVFARHLPQDPYFGAGLVNSTNRESLAFGSGAGSVYGGAPSGPPPGGLVGVIATEERSRAMRRGSPNAAGGYGPPPPSNGFNGMGMPRSMTMNNMSGMPQMGAMGAMGPMPMLTPGDQAQVEMQQQMSQFMQMQMQFMQMMTAGQGSQGRPQSQNGVAPPFGRSSTMSNLDPGLRPSTSHQRAMSMLDPNAAPWQQRNTMFAPSIHTPGDQYAPSIAPSERSNVGLPGRYRPVSQYPAAESKSRTATMTGALQDWNAAKQGSVTVKAVKKTNVEDDDDEEGWAAMKQKREKKKSLWRSKKDENGLKEMLGYTA